MYLFQIRELCTSSTEKCFKLLGDTAGFLEVFFFYSFNIFFNITNSFTYFSTILGFEIGTGDNEREGLANIYQSWEEEAGKRA